MKEIIVKTQSELDVISTNFNWVIRIEWGTIYNRIYVTKTYVYSVEAWGNSSVLARENSRVEAWENSSVHLFSDYATVILFMFSVCWKLAKGKIEKKSKNAIIIEPKYETWTIKQWLENNGIKNKKEVILYKRVSNDWKTQENTKNETLWKVWNKVIHTNWSPEKEECWEWKFHACSTAYFCDEFRSTKWDRYVALKVKQKDMYAWKNPLYPHKIAFRECEVLFECDKFGKKLW